MFAYIVISWSGGAIGTLAMAKSKTAVSIICSGVGTTIFDELCKTGSTVSHDWPRRTDTHAFRKKMMGPGALRRHSAKGWEEHSYSSDGREE